MWSFRINKVKLFTTTQAINIILYICIYICIYIYIYIYILHCQDLLPLCFYLQSVSRF